jgi:hypothetical protein
MRCIFMFRANVLLIRGALLAACVFAMSGCFQPKTKPVKSTDTKFDVFIPPHAPVIHPKKNQKIVLGDPISQSPPTYPVSMINKDIAQRIVCISISIDSHGSVYDSELLYGMLDCPASAGTVEPEFVTAAKNAVKGWKFYPSFLCTFPKGVDASTRSTYCAAEGAKVEHIPIRLAFKFTFVQTHGATEVHSDALKQ